MKNTTKRLIALALVIYSVYGLNTGELYVPGGKSSSGSYVSGDRLIWVFLSYLSFAITLILLSLPIRKPARDRSLLMKDGREVINAYKSQIYRSPQFIAIYFTMAASLGFLFMSLGYSNA